MFGGDGNGETCFLSCYLSIYMILAFVSWPSIPKICTLWLLTAKFAGSYSRSLFFNLLYAHRTVVCKIIFGGRIMTIFNSYGFNFLCIIQGKHNWSLNMIS